MYISGKTAYLIPAEFTENEYLKLQAVAVDAFKALNARDFARVDMIVNSNTDVYVLELNSIPGFTPTSLLPKAAKFDGISFEELCLQLLQMAVKRGVYGKTQTA